MALVALTDIDHGLEDGKRVLVKAGDKIPTSISGTALKILKEAGSVGEPKIEQSTVDEKDARIAELEKQLAEATAAQNTSNDK